MAEDGSEDCYSNMTFKSHLSLELRMAVTSWQDWLFTIWALFRDSCVWIHSISAWNIAFSFMFPPNSLWELNYLDWYGRVEWKWHFYSTELIWILASPYSNSICLSNLLTFLFSSFLTEKKGPWQSFLICVTYHMFFKDLVGLVWYKHTL